jgi:nitrate/nitrite-specific signal transduction histidine kinase
MNFWVIRPVTRLAVTAQEWANRNFSARTITKGPVEFRFLAEEFNKMSKRLETHEKNRTAELEQAKEIQTNLLPATKPDVKGITIEAKYQPADVDSSPFSRKY